MSYATQNDLLLNNLMAFYKDEKQLTRMLNIITGESSISLRIVDWFVTNFAKKYYTLIDDENNKRFKVVVLPVNLSDLNVFAAGSVVDLAALQQAGLINGTYDSVKVLGRGELTQKLTVRANAFSETARAAIEKLGGTAEIVS